MPFIPTTEAKLQPKVLDLHKVKEKLRLKQQKTRELGTRSGDNGPRRNSQVLQGSNKEWWSRNREILMKLPDSGSLPIYRQIICS